MSHTLKLQPSYLNLLTWVVAVASIVFGTCSWAQSELGEPDAGTWKTWVISSGEDFRVPPPPDASAGNVELTQVGDLMQQNGPDDAEIIRFWDAGSPAYRWIDLLNNRLLTDQQIQYAHRIYAYMTMAMYDTTIAAWELKYFYNRPRPSAADATLETVLPTPPSPLVSVRTRGNCRCRRHGPFLLLP